MAGIMSDHVKTPRLDKAKKFKAGKDDQADRKMLASKVVMEETKDERKARKRAKKLVRSISSSRIIL